MDLVRCTYLALFMLWLLPCAVCSGEGNGYLTGKVLTVSGEPLSGGTVKFFHAETGPSPITRLYSRMHDDASPIGNDGSFSAYLPEGRYFLMALKSMGASNADLPPKEGDLVFPSLSAPHEPVVVTGGSTNPLGVLSATRLVKGSDQVRTVVAGRVLDAAGKPVPGVLVLASAAAAMTRPNYVADFETDSKGRFEVAVPGSGPYYLRTKGQREISASVEARSGTVTAGVEIRPRVAQRFRVPTQGSSVCGEEDFETAVGGNSGCLAMKKFGFSGSAPDAMVIWLHGDLPMGGGADYLYPLAEQLPATFPAHRVTSVVLVRPGYHDGSGHYSSGNCYRRLDTYTAENVADLGKAIEALRLRYRPKRVVLVGHSGGAAMAAVLLGMKPALVEGAVLAACPCDLVPWIGERPPWSLSENPILWADKVGPAVQVIALTGANDINTYPELAKTYVQALTARGVAASFQLVEGAGHGDVIESKAVTAAVARILSMSQGGPLAVP